MGKNSVQELVAAVGVSGYEKAICSLITEKLTGLSDEVYADNVGNVICFRKGTDSQHKVMLISHMDEVGFQIMKFNNDGSAKLKPIENVKTWNSVNQIIRTVDGRVGIIICDDPSDIKPYDFNKLVVIPIIGEWFFSQFLKQYIWLTRSLFLAFLAFHANLIVFINSTSLRNKINFLCQYGKINPYH